MDGSFQSRSFPTTLWTVVLRAGRDEPAQVRAALEQLCQAYWYPLYSFIQRRGYSAQDADDVMQAFFTQLLEKRGLERVDPELGTISSRRRPAGAHPLPDERRFAGRRRALRAACDGHAVSCRNRRETRDFLRT
jgi:hypothetical protein